MTKDDEPTAGSMIWSWTKPVTVATSELGDGRAALFIPAPSSISTRREMLPLMREFAGERRCIGVDLPGFGDGSKPPVDWTAGAYRRFVAHACRSVSDRPVAVLAAGHAATYALQAAVEEPGLIERLAMIAPTWRGPLPTVFGPRPRIYEALRRIGGLPIAGAALYRTNVNGPMLRMMTTGHVYGDRGWLTAERMEEKAAVVRAKGARHASIRFVTGGLDPLSSREAWLDLLRSSPCSVRIVYGADTPKRTRAEIEAAAELGHVEAARLPSGKLAVHEEHPREVAAALRAFLRSEAVRIRT